MTTNTTESEQGIQTCVRK